MAFSGITGSSSNVDHPMPAPSNLIQSVRVINPVPQLQTSSSRTNQDQPAASGPEGLNSLCINVPGIILDAINLELELDRLVLQNMKDACKCLEFSNILDEYFENSTPLTLEFCQSLVEYCSKLEGHLKEFALSTFQEKHFALSAADGTFKNFITYFLENACRTAADPVPVNHFRDFSRVYLNQIAMMPRLEAKSIKLERTFDRLVYWRKVSNRIFLIMFGTTLIGSVVSAYENAPAGLTALFAAIAVPLGSIGGWVNLNWAKWERNIKEQREIIRAMQIGSHIVFQEFGGITELVDRFQIEYENLLAYVNHTNWEDDELSVTAMEDMKKKMDDIVKTIHGLSEHSSKCAHETKIVKAFILHRIDINHPGGYYQDTSMFP